MISIKNSLIIIAIISFWSFTLVYVEEEASEVWKYIFAIIAVISTCASHLLSIFLQDKYKQKEDELEELKQQVIKLQREISNKTTKE